MKTQFKIGDRVRSRQPGQEYTGTIIRFDGDICYVKKDYEMSYDWQCKLVGDKIATGNGMWDRISYLEKIEDETGVLTAENLDRCIKSMRRYYFVDEACEITKPKKTIMENIVTFAKNLVLSADEKLLREAGLKDSCGNYTSSAFDILEQKYASENEAYLVEIATAQKADKASKK